MGRTILKSLLLLVGLCVFALPARAYVPLGLEYIDGGIVSPLPVRELRGGDKIIAVNTLPSTRSTGRKSPGVLGVTLDAITAAQMRLAAQAGHRADVLLQPVCQDGHWRDYSNHGYYIGLGRVAALEKIVEIEALASTPTAPRFTHHIVLPS